MIDYAGNGGTDQTNNDGWGEMGNGKDGVIVRRPDGTSSRSQAVSSANITDGASNTLLVAERTSTWDRWDFGRPRMMAATSKGGTGTRYAGVTCRHAR